MKKMIFMLTLVAVLINVSCSKDAPYKSGPTLGEIYVTAESGRISVFVETTGQWRVTSDADWLSLDVEGGLGQGAFTVSYMSNESDILNVKASRKGVVAIFSDDRKTDYAFAIIQQGFYPDHELSEPEKDPHISIEFENQQASKRTFVLCSKDGVGEKDLDIFNEWLESFDAAIVGDESRGSLPGVDMKGADFKSLSPEQEYDAFVNLIETTYNADNDSDNDWIIAGQLYHLSMMQAGYPSAPQWYPLNGRDTAFDADRYAWRNNLYDCLWMSERDYITTYTGQVSYNEGELGSWQADYVYLSRGLIAKVYSVEILDKPVESMEHDPICVTFNY